MRRFGSTTCSLGISDPGRAIAQSSRTPPYVDPAHRAGRGSSGAGPGLPHTPVRSSTFPTSSFASCARSSALSRRLWLKCWRCRRVRTPDWGASNNPAPAPSTKPVTKVNTPCEREDVCVSIVDRSSFLGVHEKRREPAHAGSDLRNKRQVPQRIVEQLRGGMAATAPFRHPARLPHAGRGSNGGSRRRSRLIHRVHPSHADQGFGRYDDPVHLWMISPLVLPKACGTTSCDSSR